MKQIMRVCCLAAAFAVATAQLAAEGFTLELGATGYGTDIGGANYGTAGNQANWLPSVDPFVNFGYNLKLDKDLSIGFVLNVDDNMMWLAAKKPAAGKLSSPGDATSYAKYEASGVDGVLAHSLRVNPGATLKAGGFSFGLAVPLYFNLSSSGNSADSALAVLPKGIAYLAKWMGNKSGNTASAANTAIPYDGVNNNIVDLNGKLSYKIPLGTGFALTPYAEADLALSPFWLADVFAGLALQTGPLTSDFKVSMYNTPNDPNNLDAVTGGALLYVYLDPKLTLDFASLGAKGLKMWVLASIPVSANTNAAGQSTALYGAYLTPGVSFASQGFLVEFNSKLNYFDQGIGTPTTNPAFTYRLEWDPTLKLSYTFAF